LDYYTIDARAPATNNIPFLGDHKITYESIGVGLVKDSSLMGTFPTPLPLTTHHIATVNMISTANYKSSKSSDSWIIPRSLEFDALGDIVPLVPTKTSYVSTPFASPSSDDRHLLTPNVSSMQSWLSSLSSAIDYISSIFPSDESIPEMLHIDKLPWDNNCHISSFLPPHEEIQEDIHSISPPDVDFLSSPMVSTSDDLDLVVDMVISSLGLLEPDLLTPVVSLDMCSFPSDYLPSNEDLLEAMITFCPLTWYLSRELFSWKP
jgi:hypothetical protein